MVAILFGLMFQGKLEFTIMINDKINVTLHVSLCCCSYCVSMCNVKDSWLPMGWYQIGTGTKLVRGEL